MVRVDDNEFHIGTEIFSILLLACLVIAILIPGCEKKLDNAGIITDKPLADFQVKLLDIAFETAMSIPVKPHIKDRSRAQEAVVTACLKLDQPKRAIAFAGKIDNWRLGLCYADIAFYCAQHGYVVEPQRYIDLADIIAEDTEIEDWRRDKIKNRIAQTHALLKQIQKTEDSFDEQFKVLNELVASGVFDTVKNAMESATQFYNRFYDNVERRTLLENKIRSSWGILPVFIRLDILTELADAAANHDDKTKTLELVNEAQLLLDGHQWPAEQKVARIAQLVKLRYRAGDIAKATTDANDAITFFNKNRESIVNIYRAGVLRPLAEAYQTTGDKEAALSIYKRAVEEGIANPNSRPRAEDLSATCCSMAQYGLEPDAELWTRIIQIRDALGNPW